MCVCVCVFVRVLPSNKYHAKSCFGDFFVLIFNLFSNNTVSLFETFMTISTMNTKSGTNGILAHRTKRGIILDLQKQMI